jgi:hypothetical protein
MFLNAVLFPVEGSTPRTALVCAIVPTKETVHNPRFPVVEAIFGPQHPIYSSVVRVKPAHHQRQQKFLVFFQFAATLPTNDSVEATFPDLQWRGEILAMRVGVKGQVTGIVNERMRRLARIAIQR